MKRFIGGMVTGMALVGICWMGSPPKIKTVEAPKTVYVPVAPEPQLSRTERLSRFEKLYPGYHERQRQKRLQDTQDEILQELQRQERNRDYYYGY